jgi:hypothetical protein
MSKNEEERNFVRSLKENMVFIKQKKRRSG